ncbi:hypothetical protein FH972_021213 [Carpinus fangiana]|uniref:FAD/NAD(P)-binding domain-containing protein n=1 Tax=Carpinus fangiana TaxID=176857 RepID=A0A5N6KP27_9ROSI|nr:hypothetical protein FH972_021213 [Carpinus fangiana]
MSSKTSAAASDRSVVILGASFAGQSAAHYIFKHVAPALEAHPSGASWKIHLIDPSTHFWWRPSAPRSIVTGDTVPHEKAFIPITEGFKQYASSFTRVKLEVTHGECTSVDFDARTVKVKNLASGRSSDAETVPYYALIIASGTRTPTPLTSLQGNYTTSITALDEMRTLLASGKAKEIVIGGGGPVGVETAGELGEKLNGAAGFFSSTPANPKAKITLVVGGDKMLPILRQSLSEKAEKLLRRVGVNVIYGARITSVDNEASLEGKKTVHLDNGKILSADVYIPAVGTKPNSEYLPSSMLDSKGYVTVNAKTLRIDNVGPRVYCVGDVGNYSRGGVMALYDAIPVFATNFANDLWEDLDNKKSQDKQFTSNLSETQVVPVGKDKGVGAFNGWQLPSFAVSMIKGKDYMLSMTGQIAHGTKW